MSAVLKRVYKFILKRAIGQLIVGGDLDLNQLEVQLASGTIELLNLKLNVDGINQVLAPLPLAIAQATVAKVTVRIPWRTVWFGDHCQVDLDGLDVVFAAAT